MSESKPLGTVARRGMSGATSVRRDMAMEELAMWCLRNADLIEFDKKIGFRMSLPAEMKDVVQRMAALSMPADNGKAACKVIANLIEAPQLNGVTQ
jgi:hypothetical protein